MWHYCCNWVYHVLHATRLLQMSVARAGCDAIGDLSGRQSGVSSQVIIGRFCRPLVRVTHGIFFKSLAQWRCKYFTRIFYWLRILEGFLSTKEFFSYHVDQSLKHSLYVSLFFTKSRCKASFLSSPVVEYGTSHKEKTRSLYLTKLILHLPYGKSIFLYPPPLSRGSEDESDAFQPSDWSFGILATWRTWSWKN